MKTLLVLWLLFLSGFAKAQFIPDVVTLSPETFAQYLNTNFSSPQQKLRSLYSWITQNIRYDADSVQNLNWSADHEIKILTTLRRRSGVCENFASLLADIARRAGIPAYVVRGYPAGSGGRRDQSHSWVAVQQAGDWYLCDPTWDAESASERYFMQSPATFIESHIPFDPLWQLLERPIHYKTAGRFMYKDSVSQYLQLDSLQQYLSAERRMQSVNNPNVMTRNWQQYNRMNIAIAGGEIDEQLYNSAVRLLNTAQANYNSFVQYRNNLFEPLKTQEEMQRMLSGIPALLKEASSLLSEIGKIHENFQYDTEAIRSRIATLEMKTREQTAFLNRYFATAAPERSQLFY